MITDRFLLWDAYVHERAKNRLQGSNGEYRKEKMMNKMI